MLSLPNHRYISRQDTCPLAFPLSPLLVTDALGHTTTSGYDDLNRLTSVTLAYVSSSGDRELKARMVEEQRKGKGNEGTRVKATKPKPAAAPVPVKVTAVVQRDVPIYREVIWPRPSPAFRDDLRAAARSLGYV